MKRVGKEIIKMKKILIAALTNITCICSFAQTEKLPVAIPHCPEGTHPVVIYEFDEFHFHRPKYNCKSGFWFCTTNGQWTIQCVPVSSFPYKSIIKENRINVIAELTEKSIRFHFPAALLQADGYSEKDLSVFNVDEALSFDFGSKKIKLITGDYAVKLLEEELVIDVNYE
ncbi:MAG: hypothetical protein IPP72_14325 [Chitinophagaceae bacterium]|nr:hypothetical protein [Chitinophagaceae bacterium]